jgi:hypothetical protein
MTIKFFWQIDYTGHDTTLPFALRGREGLSELSTNF